MALLGKPGGSFGFAAQSAPVEGNDTSLDFGFVVAKSPGNFCLSIGDGALQPGREITLIWVPAAGGREKPEIRRGKIIAKMASPCDDINAQADDFYYRLEAGKLDSGRIYIAVAAQPSDLHIGNGAIRARLVNQELSFRSCAGAEGLHFSAWSGTGAKELPVWRRYYYLGYDVEPNCVEGDFKEIKR